MISIRPGIGFWVCFFIAVSTPLTSAQPKHPHLFFDQQGMETLRNRVATNARLNALWAGFKAQRVDSSFKVNVTTQGLKEIDEGRNYGDALADMTLAYVVLRSSKYADKATELMLDLAHLSSWGGNNLVRAHISLGMALAWDVLFDKLSNGQRAAILSSVQANADNHVSGDVYANINWTTSAGEGLIGLAFGGDGDAGFNSFAASLLNAAKNNFKEKDRSVLWAHGTDGFPHQGLGYWRKYIHVGLFLNALRFNQPGNDWFHLGSEFPGSEFLQKTAYARIYADIQQSDLGTLTWADSRQVRRKPNGQFGSLGVLTLVASEYQDGTVMDFIDYLLSEVQTRFDQEDWATFIFYDDSGVTPTPYRELPLSRYWPDMEAAIFRSGWSKNDFVFFMKCGSPGGHARQLKSLRPGGHDHPDANGFVIVYNNEYLAAEDGVFPLIGPDASNNKITYGHNTILIDGQGQKGDRTTRAATTTASMHYVDAPHVGYLLGDATSAYSGIEKFHRHVIYKKGKYVIIVDELAASSPHDYEFLLGTDQRHHIEATGSSEFVISPDNGTTRMPVVFVEPRAVRSSVANDRPYGIVVSLVDLLRVKPAQKKAKATFFSLHYPRTLSEANPSFERIYEGGRSGIVVDGNEYYFYNESTSDYTFLDIATDARLCYFKEGEVTFEYLAVESTHFLRNTTQGFTASNPVVAAFEGVRGKLRLSKAFGSGQTTEVTLYHPGITGIEIDGSPALITGRGEGWLSFNVGPKQFKMGPSNARQTVTDNYDIFIETDPGLLQPDLTVSTTEIDYGTVFVGQTSQHSLQFSNRGGSELLISRVELSQEFAEFELQGVGAELTLSPGATVAAQLLYHPSQAGEDTASLVLHSNDPDSPLVEIGLHGLAQEMPAGGGLVVFEGVTNGGASGLSRIVTEAAVDAGPGSLYLVAVSSRPNFAVRSITGLGLDWQPISSQCSSRNRTGVHLWFAQGTPDAPAPVEARLAGSPYNAVISVARYSGADPTNPIDEVISKNENGIDGGCRGGSETDRYDFEFGPLEPGPFFVAVAHRNKPHEAVGGAVARAEVFQRVGIGTASVSLVEQDTPGVSSLAGVFGEKVDWAAIGTHIKPEFVVPAPRFVVDTAVYDFGLVVTNAEVTHKFTISNSGNADLVLQEVSVTGAAAPDFRITGNVPVTLPAGTSDTLSVAFLPVTTGLKSAVVQISTNAPNQAVVQIRLAGESVSQLSPDIVVTPLSADFGEVVIGEAASQGVQIQNAGNIDLTIDGLWLIGIDSSQFRIGAIGEDIVVPLLGDYPLEIIFAPKTIGEKRAALQIASSDPDEKFVTVSLNGAALDTPPLPVPMIQFEQIALGGSSGQLRVQTSGPIQTIDSDLYLAAISTKPNARVNEVSGLGLNWEQLGLQCSGRNRTGVSLWYSTGVASEDGPVTASLASSPRNTTLIVTSYSGVDAALPLGAFVSGNTNGVEGTCRKGKDSQVYDFSILPTTPGSLVYGAVARRNSALLLSEDFIIRGEFAQNGQLGPAGLSVFDRFNTMPSEPNLMGGFDHAVDWAVFAVEIRPAVLIATAKENRSVGPGEAMSESITLVGRTGDAEERVPTAFALRPNYPNPFNAETTILYELPEETEVRLVIYNILGQEVRRLIQGREMPGSKRVVWNGTDHLNRQVSSGIYILFLQAGQKEFTRPLLLQK